MDFAIYKLTDDGAASWVNANEGGASARDALHRAHKRRDDLVCVGPTYFVVPANRNPNGEQALFRLELEEAPVRVVSVPLVDVPF
jgi:hypothetical protein